MIRRDCLSTKRVFLPFNYAIEIKLFKKQNANFTYVRVIFNPLNTLIKYQNEKYFQFVPIGFKNIVKIYLICSKITIVL